MKSIVLLLLFSVLLLFETSAQGGFTLTRLKNVSISRNTAEKPQAKVWSHAGRWWCVLSTSGGAKIYRLEGTAWTSVLTLHATSSSAPDCRVVGDLVHVLLFKGSSTNSYLCTVKYDPATNSYKPWDQRPKPVSIEFPGSVSTATLIVDGTGRMWTAYDTRSAVQVRWSDAPYTTWSTPITVASSIDEEDICSVVALPGKIGVIWSNQDKKRFGFSTHNDGAAPAAWVAETMPAFSPASDNVGSGMVHKHLNVKTAADGTLYCAGKTNYRSSGYPRIILLVRRPAGNWEAPYTVTTGMEGDKPIVLLNEGQGSIKVVYTDKEGGGNIVYRESPTSAISFGSAQTLINASGDDFDYATSTHQPYQSEIVVLATNTDNSPLKAEGVLAKEKDGMPPTVSGVFRQAPTLEKSGVREVTFRVSFSEPVKGVDTGDFTAVRTGTLSAAIASLTGSGSTYEVTVKGPLGSGTLGLDVDSAGTGITDSSGNALKTGFSGGQTYTIVPTLTSVGIASNNRNPALAKAGDVVTLSFTASEPINAPVVTIAKRQVTATAATATSFKASFTLTAAEAAGAIPFTIDFSSRGGTVGYKVTGTTNTSRVVYDKAMPAVKSIIRYNPIADSTSGASVIFRAIFTEAVTGVDIGDFALQGSVPGTIASVNGSGTTYNITVNAITDTGRLGLSLKSSGTAIADGAGNGLAAGYTAGQTYRIKATAAGLPPGILYLETFEEATVFDGQSLQTATPYAFTIAQNPTFAGKKVGRWELRDTDPEVSDGTRTEVLFGEDFRLKEAWQSFAAYFPLSDYPTEDDGEAINQWHQGGSYGSPMLTLRTEDGNFQVRRRSPDGTSSTTYDLGPIPYNQWVSFVIHLKQHVSDGTFRIWLNGELKLDFRGPTMFGGPFGRWKIGIYKSDWNNANTTATRHRVWYVDDVKFGNTTSAYGNMKPMATNMTVLAPSRSPAAGTQERAGETSRLEVYPTLVKRGAAITVKTNRQEPARAFISDINGRVFSSFNFIGTTTVETSALPTGMYVITAQDTGGATRQRFIVTE